MSISHVLQYTLWYFYACYSSVPIRFMGIITIGFLPQGNQGCESATFYLFFFISLFIYQFLLLKLLLHVLCFGFQLPAFFLTLSLFSSEQPLFILLLFILSLPVPAPHYRAMNWWFLYNYTFSKSPCIVITYPELKTLN